MGPSVVGPVSDRSRPRPWTTGSALASRGGAGPSPGLVPARDPDAAKYPAGRPREGAPGQVRPGAVPGRGHGHEVARDVRQVESRLRGGVRRDDAKHGPRQVAPRAPAARESGVVGAFARLACVGVASRAGG